MPDSAGSPLLWTVFSLVILTMLALDLGLFRRTAQVVTTREALRWTLVWISLALGFDAWIFYSFGATKGLEFLTGYLIEYALSVDNILVFLVIFAHFSVPPAYQRPVLVWGVLGAIVLRGVFILLGATLLANFQWIIYVFGGFLVLTGLRILKQNEEEEFDPDKNPLFRLFRAVVPSVASYHGAAFFVRHHGRLHATPLFVVLIAVDVVDLVFAVDSIPAIFAVTRDPFIVLTSNVFAILGLRSLYFLLQGVVDKFRYLKFGLGLVLVFVGIKMVISGYYHIPIGASLAAVVMLFAGAILASVLIPEIEEDEPEPVPPAGDTKSATADEPAEAPMSDGKPAAAPAAAERREEAPAPVEADRP